MIAELPHWMRLLPFEGSTGSSILNILKRLYNVNWFLCNQEISDTVLMDQFLGFFGRGHLPVVFCTVAYTQNFSILLGISVSIMVERWLKWGEINGTLEVIVIEYGDQGSRKDIQWHIGLIIHHRVVIIAQFKLFLTRKDTYLLHALETDSRNLNLDNDFYDVSYNEEYAVWQRGLPSNQAIHC